MSPNREAFDAQEMINVGPIVSFGISSMELRKFSSGKFKLPVDSRELSLDVSM